MEHVHSTPMAGTTVLVTGATSGIGKATALGLATMGAHLAITGRNPQRTESAAREIRAAGGEQVDVFVADLSSQAEAHPPSPCIAANTATQALRTIAAAPWSWCFTSPTGTRCVRRSSRDTASSQGSFSNWAQNSSRSLSIPSGLIRRSPRRVRCSSRSWRTIGPRHDCTSVWRLRRPSAGCQACAVCYRPTRHDRLERRVSGRRGSRSGRHSDGA